MRWKAKRQAELVNLGFLGNNFKSLAVLHNAKFIKWTRLGVDRIKFIEKLIWSGVEWRGPAIRQGLYNRHLIIEGHRGIRMW